MNTTPFTPRAGSKRAAAFTLLELLVVIAIIAVLAGLLLPVSSSVMDNARKADAKSTEMQIVSSIKTYQTDYGAYPPPATGTTVGATPVDTTYLGSTNAQLFAILRATDVATTSPNTRRTIYFEGKDAKNASVPKDGFIPANSTGVLPVGTLVDPWGNGFMVRYDTGFDDAVVLPETEGAMPSATADSTGLTTGIVRFSVIAWSYGKDGQVGNKGNFGVAPSYTYGDDVVSWQ